MMNEIHKRMAIVGAVLLVILAPMAVTVFIFRTRAFSAARPLAPSLWAMFGAAIGIGAVTFLVARWVIGRGYRPRRVKLAAALLAMGLFLASQAVINPDMMQSLLGGALWIVPMTVGFSLIGSGTMRRIGTERFCIRCDYPFIDAPAVIRCPECGAGWLGAFGTVTGRRQASRVLVVIGVVCAVGAFGLQMAATAYQSTFMRAMPTSLLIHQAATTRSFDNAYWAALVRRTLTPEQERALALGLLDARLAGNGFSAQDEGWIDGRVRAGVLPGTLVERYFAEMVGPARIRVVDQPAGAPAAVLQVEAALRTNLRNTQDPRIVAEGWWVDGVFTPTPDTGAVRSTYSLAAGQAMTGSINAVRLTLPPLTSVAPGPAGAVRVKFVGWIAIGPFPGVAWQATWSAPPGQPGATPTVPGATSWMRRIEVETDVDVR